MPSLPWQRIGTDLFEWDKTTYLLIIDYYSRWIEIAKLTGLSANSVINHTKSIFARYGIPETVTSNNGPQFSSEAYAQFAREYGFKHTTSSPNHPQRNGEAERGVRTIKNLLKKEGDPYLALLAYRSTPLEVGYSPSELLMSRKLHTTVPMTEDQRKPKTPDFSAVAARDKQLKQRQKVNHDTHHGARELPALSPGEYVWVTDREESGEVVEETATRSYTVQTPGGEFRRNRRHLNRSSPSLESNTESEGTPNENENSQSQVEPEGTTGRSPIAHQTRSRHNRPPKPPERFDNSWA